MADTLRIDTGVKKIAIQRDDQPECFIEFNPSDVAFAERFYALLGDFEGKLKDFQVRSEEIDKNADLDGRGIPVNLPERLALTRDACMFIRGKIDDLFGPGTSQAVFGDALTLDMFTQFFEGITPFIKVARTEKLTKYDHRKPAGRVMK